MAGSRAPLRFASIALALARWGYARKRPQAPRRILVLHHLLLGDTLMLTALLAKLRERHPAAEIVMTVPRAYAPLYEGRPYGVVTHPFDPRDFATFRALLAQPRFDLAILPADNRWSWLARALGIRWIVALAGDRPAHKNWPVDETIPYSTAPSAFCETAAALAPGPAPAPYAPSQWPAPRAEPPPVAGDYAVLHVGASSSLKLWPAERWRALADALEREGLAVVWSSGPGETAILEAIDAASSRMRIAGTLSLAQLWHVLARAKLLVCPDTGVAHLGRVIGVPTVTLFGPGSALICGPGEFFAAMPGRAVTVADFPCRDQTVQFFREVAWVRRCERLYGHGPGRCPRARCMEAIEVADVVAAIRTLRLPSPAPRG
jgi:ADP-heptose:LPS heptosyltransferase